MVEEDYRATREARLAQAMQRAMLASGVPMHQAQMALKRFAYASQRGMDQYTARLGFIIA